MPGKKAPLRERFDAKVLKGDGCWEWQATKNNKGYGMIGITTAIGKRLAHRVSYELHIGPIPDGLCVLHRCDNPACVRPGHLFLGTKRDNVADMDTKGRRVVGINPDNKPPRHTEDDHPRAKLTVRLVEALRHRHAAGASLCALARECDVNKTVMRRALQGKTWPSAGGPLAVSQPKKYESYIGSTHANSKLTEEIVRSARMRHANGLSGQKLADEYGVSISVMYDALKGRSWKHVT